MIEHAKDAWLKALIAFLYLYGCRCSEALQMKKEDVWVQDGILHARIPILKRKKHSGPYEKPTHILRVKANAPFAEHITLYLDGLKPSERLFKHSRWWSWKRIKQLNSNISPHVFRHDRLTKIAIKRPDPYLLKDWAGWSDTRPAEYYVESVGYRSAEIQNLVE